MFVKFCGECSNMLYPMEDKALRRSTKQRSLIYACRSCGNKEAVTDLSEPVFRHVIAHQASEVTQETYDVTADPTLPRTYETACRNCGHKEAVYFQVPVGKNDDMLVLHFVCVNCRENWFSSDD
mmetsp:Transcript_18780/g.27141  ORF Transcript_18780/g.27141 Transcript_18780/m.27141 type:complete len:124 (-) Transcript_18780:194-565(-)